MMPKDHKLRVWLYTEQFMWCVMNENRVGVPEWVRGRP